MLLVQPFTAGLFPPATAFHSNRHLLLPLLFPLALHALIRRRLAVLPAMIGCAVWIALVVGWQRDAHVVDGEVDLRIVTMNLGFDRSEADPVGDAIEALEADVVVLQEVGDHHVDGLRDRLAALYPHQVWHPRGKRGKALLSRAPIVREELLVFSDDARFLDASLDVDGREVRVLNVHVRPWVGLIGRLSAGVQRVEELAGASQALTLIAGDLNSVPESGVTRGLEALGFANAFDQVGGGAGFTFPVAGRYWGWPGGPMYCIDHVLHGPAFTTLRATIGESTGADHLPLVVDLQFTESR